MTYWACARLELRREAVAQHFLKLNGFETYIPRVREQRLRRGKRIETISPLFPAYAFIVIEQQWHRARWSIGVAALIMDGEHPARGPDQGIAGIRARAAAEARFIDRRRPRLLLVCSAGPTRIYHDISNTMDRGRIPEFESSDSSQPVRCPAWTHR